jgi:hypothetical protein
MLGGIGLLLLFAAALAGQTVSPPQQHESVVVNIEVPVRVMKKNVFVDGLTLKDFEVFENGVRQAIEAVYLIKDKKVLREESAGGAALAPPRNVRHYILSLDLKEYLPKIGDALDFFFTEVLGPEDTLVVITPAKTYRFKPEALSRLPKPQIANQLKSKLKTDIQLGNSQYRTLMRDFYHLEEEDYPPELAEVKENMLFELAKQMRDRILGIDRRRHQWPFGPPATDSTGPR